MGFFNRERKKIETVADFVNASEEEKQEKLKELNKQYSPQLDMTHTLDWNNTSKSLYGGNKLQSENDQQTTN